MSIVQRITQQWFQWAMIFFKSKEADNNYACSYSILIKQDILLTSSDYILLLKWINIEILKLTNFLSAN